MKLLICFMLFNWSLACSSSSVDSEGNTTDETTEGEEGSEGPEQEEITSEDRMNDNGTLGSQGQDEPKSDIPPATVVRTGPCAQYPLSCGSDNVLCGQKYEHCLAPKAGEPKATQKVLCQKEGETTLTLVMNTWDRPAGQNNLLCDFWENTPQEELLYLFATNQAKVCQNEMERRKTELVKADYQCEQLQ